MLTGKGQRMVPKADCEGLKVGPGDQLASEVVLRKASAFDQVWHASLTETLSEWATPEDEDDFGDL